MRSSSGSPVPLFKVRVQEKGRILDIKEVIVRVEGLPTCLNGQIVDLGKDVKGIIMGYDEEDVRVLVLGDPGRLRMGSEVSGVSEPFRIPVGEAFIGRMVNALGVPMDQAGDIVPDDYLPVLRDSPPMTARSPVDEFFPTGTKIVDMAIPLAKGQRQLILGDRITGKTVVALDAIISQRDTGMVCIYCCVGKSVSSLQKVVTTLSETRSRAHTIVMVAWDSSPVGEQYLVPFSAASMADHFASKGRDVLIVFDDLTKHAWAYRQLSLLLERPPGREAYPGDIFYVQTQLMERAGRFSREHGGGSMTFIGIAETIQGDLTGYIPSNLASMCDGQIFMSSAIFGEGVRPAVDLSLSLSIVGGRVQPRILRDLAGTLRADYAQYIEFVKLSRLQAGLSEGAQRSVRKAEAIISVFQQAQFAPVSLAEQVLLLYALHTGRLTDLSEVDRRRFCREIFVFARKKHEALLEQIESRGEMTVTIRRGLSEIMEAYFAAFDPTGVQVHVRGGEEREAAAGEPG
ncbi:F0F1 ATP synthase subunit alpha [Verrucomicrobiota bacterium]